MSSSLFIAIWLIQLLNADQHANEPFSPGRSLLATTTTLPLKFCTDEMDVMFILDSSGSVLNQNGGDEYINWYYELDTVKTIVNSAIPTTKSRVGLITYSGCPSGWTYEECRDETPSPDEPWVPRLRKVFGLNEFGSPFNDLQDVYDRVDAMNSSDFLSGWTWTREAMQLALDEFKASSAGVGALREKVIILITDGIPFPKDENHEPCRETITNGSTTIVISDTLQEIRDEGIRVLAAGVNIETSQGDEFFNCIVENQGDFDYLAGFDALTTNFAASIDFNLCPVTPSPTTGSPTTDAPTTSNPTTSEPTTSEPTMDPTTSRPTVKGETPIPTLDPTTSQPTTDEPTTSSPTTAQPTMYISEFTSTEGPQECPGLDLTITLFYFFQYDKVQRSCNICLYEESTTRRLAGSGDLHEKACERIDDFIGGIVDDYAKCMLSVCDYECTIDKLQLNPTFVAGEDNCGCNIFECGPQVASANEYHGSVSIVLGIICSVFLWI